MKNRKLFSLFMAGVLVLSLAGCSKTKTDIEKLRTENMLTKEQAIASYTNGNSNIFKITVEANNIEVIPIDKDGSAYNKLAEITDEIIAELSVPKYDETSEYISKDIYNYVKSNLDMYNVNDIRIKDIGRNSEYYVVDLNISATSRGKGHLKDAVNSIAIDGFFEEIGGKYEVNADMVYTIEERLNDYYLSEGINKQAVADIDNCIIKLYDTVTDEYGNVTILNGDDDITENISNVETNTESNSEQEETEEATEEATESTENSDDVAVDETSETETTEEQITEEQPVEFYVAPEVEVDVTDNRRLKTDINEIISIIGFSKVEKAKFPGIEYVVDTDGTINLGGFGVSGDGTNGLAEHGYECKHADIELRIIFSNKTNDLNDIKVKNVYFKSIIEDSSIASTEQSNVPNDIMTIIDDTIERVDCCRRDKDYAGLMKSGLVEDLGYSVWIAYTGSSTYIDSYDSEIKNIVYRDINNNEYILNISSYVREGARGCGSTGRYIDTYLYSIKIEKGIAVVTDIKRIGRTVVSEPTLDEVGYAYKKLLGYESYKAISDETKEEVKKTMDALYNAGTLRLLRGPKELNVNGQTVTVEKGMYDVFNKDTTIIREADVEAINSYIRNILVYKGVDVGCTYTGNITEWVGGGDNQVEFITEELFQYNGIREAVYEKVYYNLSRYGETAEWVIDERKIIESNRYKDEEYDKLSSKLGN